MRDAFAGGVGPGGIGAIRGEDFERGEGVWVFQRGKNSEDGVPLASQLPAFVSEVGEGFDAGVISEAADGVAGFRHERF